MKNFQTKLCELAFKYGSDKCPQIKHNYTPFYYDLVSKMEVKKILEIGIGSPGTMNNWPNYLTGASLYMWRDFLPNAEIFGADILPDLMISASRIKTYLCDQSSKEDLTRLIGKTGDDIDLLIDDGSHLPSHQIFTCLTLMPMLKKNVIYIIEDVGHPEIMESLKVYDCTEIKLGKKYRDDRLIIVKNKN